MLGIIVASIMLAFRIPLNSALFAFIGFQLFDISLNLSYFRVKDKRRARAMNDMFNGFMEGIGKESKHGRRDDEPRGRSEDGDDTER